MRYKPGRLPCVWPDVEETMGDSGRGDEHSHEFLDSVSPTYNEGGGWAGSELTQVSSEKHQNFKMLPRNAR